MKPIAVVTGGAGFIGSHMVDLLLERGYAVRAIDNLRGGRKENVSQHSSNQSFSLEEQDIRNCKPDDAVFKGAKYVFHFAGIGDIVPSIEQPTEYMDANVQGTVRVLECARAARVEKLVYAASSSCYGLAATPTREDHPIAPQYPYALSKYLGELAALHWHQVYGLPVNSIRIFNAYGPRVRTTGVYGAVFGVFFRQKLAGRPYTVVGDGSQTRDFLYVTDIAEAFRLAAESPASSMAAARSCVCSRKWCSASAAGACSAPSASTPRCVISTRAMPRSRSSNAPAGSCRSRGDRSRWRWR